MKIKAPIKDKEFERAVIFLIEYMKDGYDNDKPLILHSIQVGLKLLELKQEQEVVIAGVLHDLVEDTNCTIKQIEQKFGKRVGDLVLALTQEKIEDYKERWGVLLNKIKKIGKDAMIIKTVDFYENLPYAKLIKNNEYLREIAWKHNFAMDEMEPFIGDLQIFKDCRAVHQKLFKKLDKNF